MLSFLIFLSSGLFLGWSLGANDGANIFGTAVGTRMLRFKTAAVIASIFVIMGAVFAGEGTTKTLNELGNINTMVGAFAVELAAAIAVYLMVRTKVVTSTSQAIVGAIIGWNIYSGKATDFSLVSTIAVTWIVSPIIAGILAIGLFYLTKLILKKCNISLLRQDSYTRIGLILAGAFSAYALGANNISNVMGAFVASNKLSGLPLFGLFTLTPTQVLFLLGAIFVGIGIFTYSHNNMNTVGHDVMQMSPATALVVVIAQAMVLFLFASPVIHSWLIAHNLPTIPLVPISSSQAVIGAVMAIGLIKGGHGINWKVVSRLAIGWIATPIISAIICHISLFILANVFNLHVYN